MLVLLTMDELEVNVPIGFDNLDLILVVSLEGVWSSCHNPVNLNCAYSDWFESVFNEPSILK